jgi:hypothetical protein
MTRTATSRHFRIFSVLIQRDLSGGESAEYAAWLGAERTARKQMVGLGGLEPPASPLSGVRSNHLSYRPSVPWKDRAVGAIPYSPAASRACTGGADRDRTDDPLLAKQVLSQLSYSPNGDLSGCAPRLWMQVSCVGTLGW